MPTKPADSIVIRRPRRSPTARLALVLAAIAVVAGASLAGYWGGRAVLHEKLEASARETQSLEKALRERRTQVAEAEAARQRLSAELQAVRERLNAELETTRDELTATRRRLENTQSSLTKVTRQLQIDQTAYRELRRDLEASHRQITELAGELKFYRSIISPADGRSGVRIQKFELEPADTANAYRYRLTLIQALEHDDAVQGRVRFEISGTQDGGSRTISSPSGSQGPIAADFKYFQNFAGTFRFPGEFMPAEVKVIFEADDEVVVQRTYSWPADGQRGDHG